MACRKICSKYLLLHRLQKDIVCSTSAGPFREISSSQRRFKGWKPPKLQDIPEPETFDQVVFPPEGGGELKPMPKVPTFIQELGEQEVKLSKRMIEIRGPEEVHTTLWHKQYGIVALAGGLLKHEHFDLIHQIVNRHMNAKRFAVWRVEAPWLPKTKKRAGARMGGGKGNIHHYVTPVREGRIILEVGGYITKFEAQSFMAHIAGVLPFDAAFVTEEDMEQQRQMEADIQARNINRYDWEFVMKWNMQNCNKWLNKYDFTFKGKYK